MKNYHIFLLILVILSPIIISNCKIINSNEDEVNKRFIVIEIYNMTLDEFVERFNPVVYPKKITLSKHEDFNFIGEVEFDSIGVQKIRNYDEYTENIKSYYIDTKSLLGPVEFIHFYDIEINDESLNGNYVLAGPLIDTSGFCFKAKKK